MTKRSLAKGLLVGPAMVGIAAIGWNDALPEAIAAQVSSPVLPVEIVTADEDYNGTLMNSVLLSYWGPLLQLIREDYPDATRRQALRPRGYEIGGDEIQDQSGLLEEVHASATESGWKPVPKYSFDSAVFSMRGYEFDGKSLRFGSA
ncbi:hypothetical protein QW131_04990 [Roseibium salinum]|nr:hypothetical protein [Roseibium salinum]